MNNADVISTFKKIKVAVLKIATFFITKLKSFIVILINNFYNNSAEREGGAFNIRGGCVSFKENSINLFYKNKMLLYNYNVC